MRRTVLAAAVVIALLTWARRRQHREPTDFVADALEFLGTVTRPFDPQGRPGHRSP